MYMHINRDIRLVLITIYSDSSVKDKIMEKIGSSDITYISSSKSRNSFLMTKYKYSDENMESISVLQDNWKNLYLGGEHRVLVIDECIEYILNHDEETYELIEDVNNSNLNYNITCIYAIKDKRDVPSTIDGTFIMNPSHCVEINGDVNIE